MSEGKVNEVTIDSKVLELLGASDSPVSTLELARGVGGKGSTTKLVNPTLYKLERDGKIVKTAEENGSKPHWALKK
jgi:hypothetical protein